MKKKVLIIICSILLFFVAALSGFLFLRSRFTPVVSGEATENVRLEIPYGMSVYDVSEALEDQGLIKSSKFFYYSVRFPKILDVFFPRQNADNNFALKSGIYNISNNLNVVEIQKLLSSGQQEFVKVSIPEGLTISKVGELLEENRVCGKADFIASCKSHENIDKYNITGSSLEGYLFPDTYFFNINMEPDDVVNTMVTNFFNKIKTIDNIDKIPAEDLSKVVTLASIVEKEYRVPEEAPLIASVFENRLHDNIGLYSCATVVYIMTEIQGKEHPKRVLLSDTKIDNPYNTYKWAGLPPGPIANPGLVALDATINAPDTDYYFFQIADQDEGRHVFTSTFEEHKINHTLNVK